MSTDEILDDDEFSVALAPQSDINTVGSSWTFIDCMKVDVSPMAAQVDEERSKASRGAASEILAGRVWQRMTFTFPEVGQLTTYDPTSDTPALQAAMALLDFFGGSSGIAKQSSGISPTDGNTVSLATTSGKYGCLLAGKEAGGGVSAMGFIQELSGGGPYAATLFEDLAAQPGSSILRIPSITKFFGTTAIVPLSARICGVNSGTEFRYLGFIPLTATRSFGDNWMPVWKVEGIAYGGEVIGSSGGLQAVTSCFNIEPLISRGGSRFVVGSNVFSTYNDGTVDADGTCDVRNVELMINFPHRVLLKPTGLQGVSEVRMRKPSASVSFAIADISDYRLSGEHFVEKAWRNKTAVSFSCYQGDTAGRITAWNIPAGLPSKFPEQVSIEGGRYRQVELRSGNYAGDVASTDAGNKTLRFSQA